MRLPGRRSGRPTPATERDQQLATARGYAQALTETGSRCHRNDGSSRFCHWDAYELPARDAEGRDTTMVAVRCTIHPGGRFLDPKARLDPAAFADSGR